MTLAKRLLLGSAAAVVGATGAQAADLGLPVAPAVDYVQICEVSGMTGWILPGSNVCFDISGIARFESNFTDEDLHSTANTGDGDDQLEFTAIGELNFDARTMTEWGLLRGFIFLEGVTGNANDNSSVVLGKAFVQVGGFVAGLTDSFFDPLFSDYATSPNGGWGGDDDRVLMGYNFAFGNGFSLGVSLEDAESARADISGNASVGSAGGYDGSNTIPDFVAALRVSQAWGGAAVYGATRYINPFNFGVDDEFGYAVGASAEINLPVGVGSSFGILGTYAVGATGYAGVPGLNGIGGAANGVVDFVLNAAGTSAELTEVYTVGAGFDLNFTSQFGIELDGTYSDVDHDLTANDYTVYGIRAGATYTPVENLEIRVGIGYESFDATNSALDDDDIAGRLRITRSF